MTQTLKIASTLALGLLLISTPRAAEQPLPEIPGITAADPFPGGCVDCHVNRPQEGMDVRLSSQMRRWSEQVDAKLLARVQRVMGDAAELSGRHPELPAQSYEDIPASCMQCHIDDVEEVPPMGPMLHALHLSGGRENHFLTLFGGQCTHCHKFDVDTGTWSLPSGPEK